MSVLGRLARKKARWREVYERVYEADRPELFFKSVAWRVVTDGEPVGYPHGFGAQCARGRIGARHQRPR